MLRVPVRCSRNGIGSFQPSRSVPMAFTMPSSGLSMICQTKVTATTGAT